MKRCLLAPFRTPTYDAAKQLTDFTDNSYTESYTYDNADNQLTEKTTGEKYNYDIQGNLTAITVNVIDKQYALNDIKKDC
ncbi:MAG: hypothetical protein JXN65_02145 [Clostridia bacterium]|nr:hypothetical protein [Clostridia bacterium]